MIDAESARAKLNLALHVRHRRADGYHELETIFAFAEAGDVVSIAPSGPELTIDGPFGGNIRPDAGNLVLRAVSALRSASGITSNAALRLTKSLPVAAGLGGGSADAAATLRLLNREWQLNWPMDRLAALGATLGADVAACVWSCTQRGTGKGDLLRPLSGSDLAGTPALLVNPGVGVATGTVFGAWDGVDHGPLPDGEPLAVALVGRNDLESPARIVQPVIGEVLSLLAAQAGTGLVRMSGSGATCFALFTDQRACEQAAMIISAVKPDWWVMSTRLV